MAIGPGKINFNFNQIARGQANLQAAGAQSLLSQIGRDKTIDEITRAELLAQTQTQLGNLSTLGQVGKESFQGVQAGKQGLEQISQTLQKAKEGQGIYAGRQLQKQQKSLLADRPGRAQTILTRS